MAEETATAWKEHRLEQQEKRRQNRIQSAKMLREAGIDFESNNAGAHLVIRSGKEIINFWPGTGLWVVQWTLKQRRGVHNLINYLKGDAK